MKYKIKCFIGWHSWTWTLIQIDNVCEPVTGIIPDRANVIGVE